MNGTRKTRVVESDITVSRSDLASVTSAILDGWPDEYTAGSGTEVHLCRFCGKEQCYDFRNNFVPKPEHKLNCPVLIAESIKPKEAK